MAFADDVGQLRKQGWSDDQIIEGMSHTSPNDQSDIQALQKQGYNSTQILEGLSYADQGQSGQNGWLDTAANFVKAPLYGVSQELGRAAATEKDALGATGAANVEQGAARGIGAAVGSYDPASAHFDLTDPSTWSYAPRAVAEGLPATGGYLGGAALGARLGAALGPEGAFAGGVIGPMLFGLNRYLGTDAETRAANDGHGGNVTQSDVVSALPGAAAQAALDTAGNRVLANNALLEASPVTGAGRAALGQTVGNVARAAAANAVTGGASDAAGQLGTSVGTQKGEQLDPSELMNAAALSGLTAGAAKGLGVVPEGTNAVRFADGDPEAKARLAALINSDRVAGDPNNPADSGGILANTESVLGSDLQQATGRLKQAIRTTQSQGGDASGLQSALRAANDMVVNLNTGYPLDDSQIATLRAMPSMPGDVADRLTDLSELNRLGRTVTNVPQASAPTPLGALRGLMHAKHTMAMLGGALGGMEHSVPLGLGVAAVPMALRLGGRLVNAATSESNPVGQFASRFGGLQRATERQAVADGAGALPLSPQGRALLPLRLPSLMQQMDQPQTPADQWDALAGFGPKDRAMLATHFERARGRKGAYRRRGTR